MARNQPGRQQAAKNLIDAAIQYQVYKTALKIAALPPEKIKPDAPEIIELQEMLKDVA
jgi:hypothetical protein